ncbi:carbohydrate ABC transporter permease [Lacrimispora celerecrescens]|uniref:Raffinose/stachyose/melibiose transport system permease protein n=2 Tax=Lacrimispora celerecrescens TaxID=29354 RepID=A0A2M8Z3Z3_9FIRM|nr:sugar ABC transporter permease [Lacrimispora celerecrescens]PJJ28147.1 raffinose/stachyose/melibiose transport system permease protein [[Clostridium] celerecrescens 18A]
MRVKKRMMVCFLLPCILLFSLIYLIPMGIVFVTSFFEWKSGGVFHFVGLRNYIEAFINDTRMHQALKNTGIWALLQSTVHVGIGTITAFILSRKIKGWKIFRTIFMIPNVISAAALGVIFLNVFNPKYGLLNSMISTLTGNEFSKNWYFDQNSAFLTVTWSWLLYAGLVMILVLAGVMSVPDEVMEAAKIDGASGLQIDFKIRLPLVRTILGTCVIISATSMLREFELIYLTTNGGPGDTTLNLPLYLYKTSLTDNNYGYANMMGVLLIILGIFAVFAINKLFRMSESDY